MAIFFFHFVDSLNIFTGFCRQCRGDLNVHLTEKVQPDTTETSSSVEVCIFRNHFFYFVSIKFYLKITYSCSKAV